MAMNKVVHAAQRAAFSVAIDATINAVRGKGPENMAEQAVKLVNLHSPCWQNVIPTPTGTPSVLSYPTPTASGCSMPTAPLMRSTPTS